MSEGSDRFDRRTVLKGIGTAALAAGGLGAATGGVAAAETKQRLADVYADERMLRAAFQEHGGGLRETLVTEGFVDPAFDFGDLEFEIDDDVAGVDPDAEDRLAGVGAMEEGGTYTALGSVSTSTDSHEVALFVQPERDEAYAFVEPKDASDEFIVHEDGVTPQGCAFNHCGDACTCCCYTTEKEYHCDPDCYDCWVHDTSCSCYVC